MDTHLNRPKELKKTMCGIKIKFKYHYQITHQPDVATCRTCLMIYEQNKDWYNNMVARRDYDTSDIPHS